MAAINLGFRVQKCVLILAIRGLHVPIQVNRYADFEFCREVGVLCAWCFVRKPTYRNRRVERSCALRDIKRLA